MKEKLSAEAAKAIEILERNGIWYRLIQLSAPAKSVEDVIRISGGAVVAEEICKTVIMRDAANNFFAVFLPGKRRVDIKKVAEARNTSKVFVVAPQEVRKVAGVEPGCVCPITISQKLHMIIDPGVLEHERINFGSGDLFHGLEMRSEDLPKVIKDFQEADIKE